jgi:hypothetical protein
MAGLHPRVGDRGVARIAAGGDGVDVRRAGGLPRARVFGPNAGPRGRRVAIVRRESRMRPVFPASTVVLVVALALAPSGEAAEGMWQPKQLPSIAQRLTVAGYDGDPRSIADLDRHPMDAVVSIGGCSAAFVSPNGLVATNHHCAYGTIQFNSTGERNLLRDGFLAADLAGELPGDPNLRVFVTDRIEDATAAVRAAIDGAADGAAAWDAYEAKAKALVAECEAAGPYRCELAMFHGGMEFNLVRQLEIRDVRLVHAPAGAIGKFGGDVDNWMWPRHTGDYAFLRAYVGPDGKPAAPSKDNVPYRPKSWLRVAGEGPVAGDFVMVAGYPGRTNRWRLAEELEDAIGWTMPTVIAANRETLRIIEETTRGRADAAVKYASAMAGLNNTLKNFEGQLAGLSTASGKTLRRRKALSERALEMNLGMQGDSAGAARVAALREQLAANRARRERDFVVGAIVPIATAGGGRSGGSGLLAAASDLYRLAIERGKPDARREFGFQARDEARIKGRLEAFDRRYDAAVDRALLRQRIGRYAALPAAQRLPEFDAWLGIEGEQPDLGGVDAKLDALYAGSKLGDAATRLRWFGATPDALRASGDAALALAAVLQPAIERIEAQSKAGAGRELSLRPAWMRAMIAFQQRNGGAVYPDANATLRVTYGNVTGYAPRDGVSYLPFTTLAGIVQKSTGVEPFDAPQAQVEAIVAGKGADLREPGLGDVPVNFLSDLDVTGGNSGSPTLNARGELVGLLFDMTWESVASNWVFNPTLTRAIHVDARYIVWVMREVDGAHHLLREMGVAGAR